MEALEAHSDIAIPKKQIDCVDNELLRPGDFDRHVRDYAALTGTSIQGQAGLIEGFYQYNATAAYAGFKSMPHRHDNFAAFVSRSDIQFITLIREDIPSTVASFMLAIRKGTWRRHGRAPQQKWVFHEKDAPEVQSIFIRLQENLRDLARVPAAIRMSYEKLCEERFESRPLDEFFGRKIRIKNPVAPISGAAYTENWDEFVEALGLPDKVQSGLGT